MNLLEEYLIEPLALLEKAPLEEIPAMLTYLRKQFQDQQVGVQDGLPLEYHGCLHISPQFAALSTEERAVWLAYAGRLWYEETHHDQGTELNRLNAVLFERKVSRWLCNRSFVREESLEKLGIGPEEFMILGKSIDRREFYLDERKNLCFYGWW